MLSIKDGVKLVTAKLSFPIHLLFKLNNNKRALMVFKGPKALTGERKQ